MKELDYEYFKKELKVKTKATYEKYLQEYSDMSLSGFALYSDESAMSISVSFNTYEYLKSNIEEEPGYDSYFRFTPGEWETECYNEDAFEGLNILLEKWNEEIKPHDWNKHQKMIYNIAVDVLYELKAEGCFSIQKEDFVLMFAVSDYSNPKEEVNFFEKLNSLEITSQFEKWILEEEEHG